MGGNSITSGPNIPSLIKAGLIRGIPPNNDLPLHDFDLCNLTKAEMLHAVLSNLFVVPDVKINTIIWKNWDIFNNTNYTWKVVRSRPECVKLLANDFRGFLCEPVEGRTGKYRALQLTDTLRVRRLRTNVSLHDALSSCENEADNFKKRKNYQDDLFSNKRSAHKLYPPLSIKHFNLQPGQPYQAEYDCFEGLDRYIEEIELLTKAMTDRKKYWIHGSETLDFENYLLEQLYDDAPMEDVERYEEIFDFYCNGTIDVSEKYFDILSAGDIRIMSRHY